MSMEPALGYRGELTFGPLTHLRARDYDPGNGVFTTPDPLADVPGTPTIGNPYHYTNNNPLNRTDPTGKRTYDCDINLPGAKCFSIAKGRQAVIDAAVAHQGILLEFATLGGYGAYQCTMSYMEGLRDHEYRKAGMGFGCMFLAVVGPEIGSGGTGRAAKVVDDAAAAESTVARQTTSDLADDTIRAADQSLTPRGGPSSGTSRPGSGVGRPDGETVFSGHGGIAAGDTARTTVPKGTCINFYCGHGETILDSTGNAIETGVRVPAPRQSLGPGSKVPDYWLEPPFNPDLVIKGNPTTVPRPTRLSELLKEDMGTCHWAACRWVE
ncbi:MAG: putative adhesin [Microthrixaceae bacterium]